MKGPALLLSLFVSIAALSVSSAQADTVVTTTPGAMTYSGVVTEINPTSNVIVLKSESSPTPITYTYTPQTVFLDTTGKTVSYETIRNVPVTVEYYNENGKTFVRRVIATKPVKVIEEHHVDQ